VILQFGPRQLFTPNCTIYSYNPSISFSSGIKEICINRLANLQIESGFTDCPAQMALPLRPGISTTPRGNPDAKTH